MKNHIHASNLRCIPELTFQSFLLVNTYLLEDKYQSWSYFVFLFLYSLFYFYFLYPIQIGSCTNQMGQIAIVSFQNSSPKVIECFNVESRILCMVYIPEEEKLKEQNKALDLENVLAKTSNVPTICLGMEEGR